MSQTQFGLPTRNAEQDANAGVVNAPAKKTVARQYSTKQESATQLDRSVQNFGQAAGNAMQQYSQDKNRRDNETRVLEAAARQGTATAINDVDAQAKRTGWDKAFFGQSVQYRQAQQQAVKNNILQKELEITTHMSEYASYTPEEFAETLKEGLKQTLAPYENDKETSALATGEFVASSNRLVQQHYKDHYAFTQEQMYQTNVHNTDTRLDLLTAYKNNITTPKEQEELRLQGISVFNIATKPLGMNPVAWTRGKLESLVNSVSHGNTGAMRYAEDSGFVDSLSAAQLSEYDAAKDKFDVVYNYKLRQPVDLLRQQLDTVQSVAQADALYDVALENIEYMGKDNTGTERAKKDVQTAKADLLVLRDTVRKAALKNGRHARNVALAEANLSNNIVEQTVLKQRRGEGAKGEEIVLTKAHYQAAADLRARRIVADAKGVNVEDISDAETAFEIISNPVIAPQIREAFRNTGEIPKALKDLGSLFSGGFEGLIDPETHQATEDFTAVMTTLKTMEQDPQLFGKIFDNKEEYRTYLQVERGFRAGRTLEAIQTSIEEGRKNQAKGMDMTAAWMNTLPKDTSKQKFISDEIMKRLNYTTMSNQQIIDAVGYYEEDLLNSGGDHKRAEAFTVQMMQQQDLPLFGKTIQGGAYLDSYSEKYKFKDMIQGISKPESGLGAGILAAITGFDKNNPAYDIDKIVGIQWKADPKQDGVWAYSPTGKSGWVHIPKSLIVDRWLPELEQQEKFRERQEEAARDAQWKRLGNSGAF